MLEALALSSNLGSSSLSISDTGIDPIIDFVRKLALAAIFVRGDPPRICATLPPLRKRNGIRLPLRYAAQWRPIKGDQKHVPFRSVHYRGLSIPGRIRACFF